MSVDYWSICNGTMLHIRPNIMKLIYRAQFVGFLRLVTREFTYVLTWA